MALRAGYYGVKRFLRDKLETIARTYDETIKSLFPRSEQAVLGAKNLFSTNNIVAGSGLVTISDNGKTINVKNATAGTYQMVKFDMPVEKNTDYAFTVDIDYVSGTGEIIISNTAENNVLARINSDVTTDRQWSATFNSGEFSVIRFRMYCTRATSETGELNYNNALLRLASDPVDTYVPYAMTNKELTDSAADQKTAINAIITAATGAADFAAFKTAMGAITPVTRSLLLAKEDITEEVKEAVEPEKTVTKKRTTKKTEEV